MHARRNILNTALLLALCVLGCTREPPDPEGGGDKVVILIESAPRDLDPRYATDASSTKVARLIHCALTTLETDDLRPALEAAQRVEPVCDGNPECDHWLVQLRRGIYWHDGVEVSARDVVYTYRSLLESRHASPFRGELQRKLRRVWEEEGVVHFLLDRPYASFLSDLAIGLVPEHILSPRDGLNGQFEDDFIGCGPFKFVSRYRDRKVVLARNEQYWRQVKPRWVVVRTVPDEATRVLSVMAGSGHIAVNTLSPPVVRKLEESPEVNVLHRDAACTTYLTFNLLDEWLSRREVRQAVAHALDRKTLVREQFRGMAQVAHSVLPPFHWAYHDDVATYGFDPAQAEALLDKAGLVRDPETGVRARFTLKVTTDLFRKNIGALIAWRLGQIGLEVELLPLELSTFLSDVRKGNFELYILQLPQVTEPDILRWLVHSQSAPVLEPQPGAGRYGAPDRRFFPPRFAEVSGPLAGECRARWFPYLREQAYEAWLRTALGMPVAGSNGNRSFFFDPTLDCALDLGMLTMDETKRLAYYQEAQAILAREVPVLPLWHEDNVAVVRQEVQGYELLPLNRYAPVTDVTLE